MELKGFNILNIVIHCTFIHIASLLMPNLIENMMMVCSVQWSDAVQCFLCMPNFTVTGKQYITGACSLDDMNLLISYHFPRQTNEKNSLEVFLNKQNHSQLFILSKF